MPVITQMPSTASIAVRSWRRVPASVAAPVTCPRGSLRSQWRRRGSRTRRAAAPSRVPAIAGARGSGLGRQESSWQHPAIDDQCAEHHEEIAPVSPSGQGSSAASAIGMVYRPIWRRVVRSPATTGSIGTPALA
ncbi:hypothetical protein WR25_18472 [Diploscapter pachys]|uniref:Uncharacterized protein n=1 Tax=Diploscapter pachys TaxID=2018661 RepID=A0A2A2K090_9BILA|nr:hypothetical protein WR25_18472 [Diploscapter pachys]